MAREDALHHFFSVQPDGLPTDERSRGARTWTSGGYPQIVTVITADLPLAAQLAPGDWVEFAWCTRREALAALREQDVGFGER